MLRAKLGLFPFFYWVVVVRVKVGLFTNMFVLRFQKIRVFWVLWLVFESGFSFLYLLVYLRIFFVMLNLLLLSDLWLIVIYSSIANTGIIVLNVFGFYYIFSIFLYLGIVLRIIFLIIKVDNYLEMLLVVFFF